MQGPVMLAVTPLTLMVDGAPLDANDVIVSRVRAPPPRCRHPPAVLCRRRPRTTAVRSLLSTLNLDRRERRTRGGPTAIWEEEGHPAIVVEQIDYQELLEREADEGPARRDVLWHSIVRSIIAGRRTFTEAEQQRLLEISRDAWAVGELADDCRSAYCGR